MYVLKINSVYVPTVYFYSSVDCLKYLKYHRKNSLDNWFISHLKNKAKQKKPMFYKVKNVAIF